MGDLTRRGFLRTASISAAVAGGAVAAGGIALPLVEDAGAAVGDMPGAATVDGPVVAHLIDPSSGTVAVYHGDRVVTVVNQSLAHAMAAVVR